MRREVESMQCDDIRELLPAFCAGSLPPGLHARVRVAMLNSPDLLAETMQLTGVALRLDEERRALRASGLAPGEVD
jgi:hypothetical protein